VKRAGAVQRSTSACEVILPGMTRRAAREGTTHANTRARAAIMRFDPAQFRWAGVDAIPYKASEDGPLAWRRVERFVLLGGAGEPVAFPLRYFEIAPGGYTSYERHRHAHAMVVVRGDGRVRIGMQMFRVHPMDLVFVPPGGPHQFLAGRRRFGCLCPVDADRDRRGPVPGRAARRRPRVRGATR
jgi:quercetin dioxygenase-like cupin family protein